MKDKETETDSLQNPQAFASAFEKTPLRNRKRLAQELFDRLSTAYLLASPETSPWTASAH